MREMWPHRESITTPKLKCGATCTKGPDREMLACESTTPRCNPHLEDKPTVGKPACEIQATKMNEKLDKKTVFDSVLQPPLQNGRFLKREICNLKLT